MCGICVLYSTGAGSQDTGRPSKEGRDSCMRGGGKCAFITHPSPLVTGERRAGDTNCTEDKSKGRYGRYEEGVCVCVITEL